MIQNKRTLRGFDFFLNADCSPNQDCINIHIDKHDVFRILAEISNWLYRSPNDEDKLILGYCGLMQQHSGDSVAIASTAPCFTGGWEVRNVLTYAEATKDAFGAIDHHDQIYQEHVRKELTAHAETQAKNEKGGE